ncbi:hypothetical protein DM02DRAFT_668655 [Periconia macrospinosa]|uniref:Fungal N-terminal domain-containing protein n=1 Tax=Periconia macrospinosa TaxID=97972 RepID=A0A2V1E313_9PLEO|nr:hypothetical protein DM02DRAFT_668655 [Periconia macrospinosa]
MSALDNLSVASNVLQVISFADTVFRVGKNLYVLFDNARSASRNISLLLHELQALLSVVASVYVVITEYASSPFAQDDGHTLPNVHTILTLIEQDFRHLRGLLGQTVSSGREGWLSSLQSNVRWALKDHEIATSRHRLSQYTQNLTAALSVLGRRNDIVVRIKLQSIEDTLRAISQNNPPQAPSSRPIFRVPRRQPRATGTQIQLRSSPQRSLVEADCTPTRLSRRKDDVITPGTADFNGTHLPFIKYNCPKIKVYEQADRTLVLDTDNYALHQVTKPAMLLRDSLIASFETMRTNRVLRISETELGHLQMLFDFLVASAHTASAESIMKNYANSSGSKTLDGVFPASKCKGAIFQRRGIGSDGIKKRSLSTYLEEKSMTLNTDVGSVKAKILSARSYTDSTTLAITFEFLAGSTLGLSPFAVYFMSHELQDYFPFQPRIGIGMDQTFLFEDALRRSMELPQECGASEEVSERAWISRSMTAIIQLFFKDVEELYEGKLLLREIDKEEYESADNWHIKVKEGAKIVMVLT